MSETFRRIIQLVQNKEIKISDHGYDELSADNILVREVVSGLTEGIVVEDYPDYPKGPCVLVLQKDRNGEPVHVVWGIPKGKATPAVVVTAYRPDAERWTEDFMRRRT